MRDPALASARLGPGPDATGDPASPAATWRLGHRPALDGLRGVAVLLVVADHAGYLPEPAGSIGVTVFFVLSGFLITRVILEARLDGTWSMAGFLANRFVRLYPALLVAVLVVSTVLLRRGYPVDRLLVRTLPALAYVENMTPYVPHEVFGQTWSLGVEEQFYLLWPLVLPWVLARARPRSLLVVLAFCSAAVMILLARDWLPMHAYALQAGCVLALGASPDSGRRRRRWLVPLGTVGLVVAIVVSPGFGRIYVYGPLVAVPAAVLLVAGAAGGNRVLTVSPLRFAGRISYALYLWHVPMLKLTHATHAEHRALEPVAWSFVLATASTFLLEEPLRRAWKRRRRGRPHPARRPACRPQ